MSAKGIARWRYDDYLERRGEISDSSIAVHVGRPDAEV